MTGARIVAAAYALRALSLIPLPHHSRRRSVIVSVATQHLAFRLSPSLQVVNKLDIPEARLAVPAVQAHLAKRGVEVLAISAVTGQGVQDVVRSVRKLLAEQPAPPPPQALSERELERPLANEAQEARDSDLSNFRIVRDGRYFIVEGAALERFTQMTNWEFFESVRRFQFVLKKVRLAERGSRRVRGRLLRRGTQTCAVWASDGA